jgi:anthranilate synthase/aminodeoxychorismate synthase-like glutamine amidotransferase
MYLLIDNYDSFTYNLYQVFAGEGVDIIVKRNDEIAISEIKNLSPEKIIISPGPKTPAEAGISNEVIGSIGQHTPILGICLGHQCIVSFFGGTLTRISTIVHGKTSPIYHKGTGIFKGLPDPFDGARYHSLETVDIPACLETTAWTEKGVVMGIRHKEFPITGLQFHPESFMTNSGNKLLKNFITGTI